jgi:hypothetical protein
MEATRSSETSILTRHAAFFIVTAVKSYTATHSFAIVGTLAFDAVLDNQYNGDIVVRSIDTKITM